MHNASILGIYVSFSYKKAMDNSHKAGSKCFNAGVLSLTLRAKIFFLKGLLSSAINLFKLSLLHPNNWSLEELKRKKEK